MRIVVNFPCLEQHRDLLAEELHEVDQIRKLLDQYCQEIQACGGDQTFFRQQVKFMEVVRARIERRQDALIKTETLLRCTKEELVQRIDDVGRGIRRIP